MAVAVALIAVDVALMGGLGRAWWLPLIGLGASLLISVAAISQPEIDTGQDITLALRMDATGSPNCYHRQRPVGLAQQDALALL
jgi:hypothetical protein